MIEYQVGQTADGAHIKIVTIGAVDAPALARRLEAALSGAGLDRPAVEIEAVPFIDRGPAGKLRRFVPLDERG